MHIKAVIKENNKYLLGHLKLGEGEGDLGLEI
jgi:hypothetical protein